MITDGGGSVPLCIITVTSTRRKTVFSNPLPHPNLTFFQFKYHQIVPFFSLPSLSLSLGGRGGGGGGRRKKKQKKKARRHDIMTNQYVFKGGFLNFSPPHRQKGSATNLRGTKRSQQLHIASASISRSPRVTPWTSRQ